jgi:hypothetical protein
MKNFAICYFDGQHASIFAGFQPVHPIWTCYSKYNNDIKWMDKEELDFSIKHLKSERRGGMISTLGSSEIISPPFKGDLFILEKI